MSATEQGGITFEDDEMLPVKLVVGGFVYITQVDGDGVESLICMGRRAAQAMADAITIALAGARP